MRLAVTSIVVLLALALAGVPGVATAPAQAAVAQHFAESGSRSIAPGVDHRWGVAEAAAGLQRVQLVAVEKGAPGMIFETSLANNRVTARQKTSLQALAGSVDGHRVVAAVNGDIWNNWGTNLVSPRGLNVRHGELVTAGAGAVPAFAVDGHGRPRIGTPTLSVVVTGEAAGAIDVTRVNARRLPDEVVLYTSRFDSRTHSDATGTEVVIDLPGLPLAPSGRYSGQVTAVRLAAGDTPLRSGEVVLSGTGLAAGMLAGLAIGERVTIDVSISDGWQDVVHSVGGPELLLRDGAVDITPYRPNRVEAANPRTALGITADGRVLMLTVDGRSIDSGGVTIDELAELMRELGAVDAVNLDGGGSTTLFARAPGQVEGSVVNTPSDGYERAVSTTLQLVSTTPTGSLDRLVVSPPSLTIYQGQPAVFSVSGHDAAYNGIPIDQAAVSWTSSSSSVTVSGSGAVTAATTGDVTLTAHVGQATGKATLTIKPDDVPPAVTPPQAALRTGTKLKATAIPVEVGWGASDGETHVRRIELQQRVNGGAWAAITLATKTTTRFVPMLMPGREYQYRVRATDGAGNVSPWTLGAPFSLLVQQETSSALVTSGTWKQRSSTSAYGGGYRRSKAVGGTMTLAVPQGQVAWIGNRSPTNGRADVYLDGLAQPRVELKASVLKVRQVLWTSPAGTTGSYTVSLRNASPSTRPNVDLDAFVVLVTKALAP